jgi:RNA polymerase sigma-70 factor, ECF subfamily
MRRETSFEPVDHLPVMRRYARVLTRDDAAADDLVHDALVRAYEKRHNFRGESLAGWLLAILHSTFLNDRRRAKAEQARIEDVAQAAPPAAEPAQEHSARLAQIQAAFQALPADQRAALHLVAVEGLSYQAAAAVLDVPPGTLMSRLGRARAALRQFEGEAASTGGRVPHLRIVGGSDDL